MMPVNFGSMIENIDGTLRTSAHAAKARADKIDLSKLRPILRAALAKLEPGASITGKVILHCDTTKGAAHTNITRHIPELLNGHGKLEFCSPKTSAAIFACALSTPEELEKLKALQSTWSEIM